MKSEFRDWSDVRVFLAVVRAGSTLAASKDLGMAQPTVARRIEALEHALGLVLFERDTRGFHPTPEAQSLIEQAAALESTARAFSERAGRLIAGKSRVIRLTAFKDAFNHRLTTVIDAFISTCGDVQFEFLPSDDRLDLANGAADVALRTAPKIEEPTLIRRKIREIGYSLFASKGYAAKHPLPSSETEFEGHKFIVHLARLGIDEANRWLLARIDAGQIALTSEFFAAIDVAVLMGLGIGARPNYFGRSNDNVIRCLELPPETALPVWFLVNPAAYRRPEVRAFTAFFVPRYRAMFQEDQVLKSTP